MATNLRNLLDEVTEKVKLHVGIAKQAAADIGKDLHDLVELGEEKLKKLIDKVTGNPVIKEMAAAFFRNAKKGRDAAVAALKRQHEKYKAKLDETARTKPGIVGFWDGFVSIFLNAPANRRTDSDEYVSNVKYGKAVGSASAVLLFLRTTPVGAALGALPVVLRGAKYLQKKVADAKKKVSSTKTAAKKPKARPSRTRKSRRGPVMRPY